MIEAPLVILYFIVSLLAYAFAVYCNKMSIMDLIWTLGLALGSLIHFSNLDTITTRAVLVLILLLTWSFRLSYFLIKNRVLNQHEDPRYERLIKASKKYWKIVFMALFLFQVVLAWVFLVPIYTAMNCSIETIRWIDLLAFLCGAIALLGESISDYQLKAFCSKPDNQGKVCKTGLWRYSRHPNYFFEWLFWWSFVIFSIGSSVFYLSLLGPSVMYLFLRYISGVPFAEMSSLERRGTDYLQYQKETSVFFPFKPKL